MDHTSPRVPLSFERTTLPDAARRHCQGTDRISSARLVIVHAEADRRLELRAAVETLGHQVIGEAGDAESARRLTRQLRPDLLLLPTSLGEEDTFAIAGAI